MSSIPEFISFHDKLTDQHHTATWDEAIQAMTALKGELGRTPTRDELLVKVLQNQNG